MEMEKSKLGNKTRIFLAIFLSILGLAGIILAFIFRKNLPNWANYLLMIVFTLILFVGLCFVYSLFKNEKRTLSTKQLTMVGIQSAITVVLYFFVKFNLPFFPPWLDIQVSEIPALITGFAYGPLAGSMVILIRFIIKLPATITGGVGEAADLLLGVVLVVTSSLIYKKHKTLKGAFAGTGLGIGIATVLACIINWLVLIPAFIYLAGFSMDTLVSMLSYLPFEVTKENFMMAYVLVGVLPFNLFRYIIVFIFTFLLYKSTHKILNRLTK